MGVFDHLEIVVPLDSLGEVSLRMLVAGDMQHLFDTVARENLTDKEFVMAILSHQLSDSYITKAAFVGIPNDALKKLAIAFIENEEYIFREYKDTEDVFVDFRRLIAHYVEKEKKLFYAAYGSSIEQAEKLIETINSSGILMVLQSFDLSVFSEVSSHMNTVLAGIEKITSQTIQGVLAGNIQTITRFSEFWQEYYTINAEIANSISVAISAQMLSTQRIFTQVLLDASSLSIKSETIFVENVKEINTYPTKQKEVLYKEADILFFSVNDLEVILREIKGTVERDSQGMFWDNRAEEKLRKRPESIAQGLMMSLLYAMLPNRKVMAFQQSRSGSGFIDIILTFANTYGDLEKLFWN
ncbi:MAG TPA: hypothetical protein VGE97_00345 [Nitrososphaera sp.]|jgi:hypothetical protein